MLDAITWQDAARFWSKVEVGHRSACWIWQGKVSRQHGYGRFYLAGRQFNAHRVAFVIVNGPEAVVGLDVDHACHNADLACAGGSTCMHRLCCNPAHLEAATRGENVLRGAGDAARRARQTHCIRGHLFDKANTRISPSGYRQCRACVREVHNHRARAKRQLLTKMCHYCGENFETLNRRAQFCSKSHAGLQREDTARARRMLLGNPSRRMRERGYVA